MLNARIHAGNSSSTQGEIPIPTRSTSAHTGTGPGPFIETDAHGYAIAASAPDEAGLSVTSAQVQEATAESLDGRSAWTPPARTAARVTAEDAR